jgi:hypothetical protein
MTTFIADFIFGKRDRRPRSRPSPAARLMARLRPTLPTREAASAAEIGPTPIDTGPPLVQRAVPGEDRRPGLRP